MRERAEWKRDNSWWEAEAAKQAADARTRGDAYLKYWAAWAKSDPSKPRLAKTSVIYVGRYDEPEKLKLRPEAVGDWMDDLADAVGRMVLALPPKEREAVLAYYIRIWIRPEANTEICEHIRAWTADAILEELNRLRRKSRMNLDKIPRRTFFDRIARSRDRVEDLSEQMNLPDPPHT
jgi:hypothetical protein